MCTRVFLFAIALLFTILSLTGITWGLPSRKIDKYLFGDGPVWPGEKIYRLAGGAEKFSGTRGADVDVNPLQRGSEPVLLTATEEDVARIYLRYRLYTYQPDEMITMMALARMKPRSLDLDPRLYQYGGLFIYPVGALIGLGGRLGLIDVRSDVTWYLDYPDEFGKFYLVARGYAAAWGVLGVFIVFGIARRLGGTAAGILAALLFTLMPVVICMAHEGKPHLPGAVLMLAAAYFAMRHVENACNATSKSLRDWWLMCICCGAALGMVLSSLPIFILIPLTALLSRPRQNRDREGTDSECIARPQPVTLRNTATRMLLGFALASAVYFITNPYILINALTNRDILRSNFGNSLAMYQIARIGEGFGRVIELTAEGATWPVLLIGIMGFVWLFWRRQTPVLPLAIVALIIFLQFVLIGAGKPGEYGRFGIFTNTALAIAVAVECAPSGKALHNQWRWLVSILLVACVAWSGSGYAQNFIADAGAQNSRMRLAHVAGSWQKEVRERDERPGFAVLAEPAPYCFPPIDFAQSDVLFFRSERDAHLHPLHDRLVFLKATDRPNPSGIAGFQLPPRDLDPMSQERETLWPPFGGRCVTEISWANKPFQQNWRATRPRHRRQRAQPIVEKSDNHLVPTGTGHLAPVEFLGQIRRYTSKETIHAQRLMPF